MGGTAVVFEERQALIDGDLWAWVKAQLAAQQRQARKARNVIKCFEFVVLRDSPR